MWVGTVMVETLIDETLVVDVSDVDWSNHPGWARDFDASVMECDPGRVPVWAGDVIARIRTYRLDDGSRVRRRERVCE